jgi:phenol 2-monooxygenase
MWSSPSKANSEAANSVQVGKRLPSYEVISHAEGIKYQVHDLLPSNGKWRIVVFPGRLQSPAIWDRTEKLGDSLHKLLTKFTTVNQRIHSVIEVILIHAGGRRQINMLDLHNVFHPWDEEEGWDYWKVFCEPSDDSSNSSYIYDELAISRDRGCMLAIRPDQHVSAILPLQSTEQLDAFFSNFMQFSAKKVI